MTDPFDHGNIQKHHVCILVPLPNHEAKPTTDRPTDRDCVMTMGDKEILTKEGNEEHQHRRSQAGRDTCNCSSPPAHESQKHNAGVLCSLLYLFAIAQQNEPQSQLLKSSLPPKSRPSLSKPSSVSLPNLHVKYPVAKYDVSKHNRPQRAHPQLRWPSGTPKYPASSC